MGGFFPTAAALTPPVEMKHRDPAAADPKGTFFGQSTADPAAGLAKLHEMKAKAPGAAEMSDAQFAVSMHQHYYKDLPMVDFLAKVGLDRGDVLYELRAPGDAYGDYLRQALGSAGQGEDEAAVAERQMGAPLDPKATGGIDDPARAALQGATFGFGDELVAAGASALDPLVHGDSGKDFGQRFDAYLGREQGQVEDYRQDNPVAAYGSEIAGAIPTAAVAGGNLVAQANGLWPKLAAMLGVGGAQGATYGFGSTEGDFNERLEGAKWGAALGPAAELGGAALGSVVGGVGDVLSAGAARRAAVDAAPAAADLRATSQAAYRAADQSGVQVTPAASSILRHDLLQTLSQHGMRLPNGNLAPGVSAKLRQAITQLDNFANSPMSIPQLRHINRLLQKVAKKGGDESAIAMQMVTQLDDFVEALPQSGLLGNAADLAGNWMAGKQGWRQFKRTEDIENAIYNAQVTPTGQFSTNLRSQIGRLLKANRKRRRFSDDEVAAMEHFVAGGPVDALMQTLASGGGLPGALMGGVATGPVGAVAVPALGMLSRMGLDSGAGRGAAALRAQIASGGAPIGGGAQDGVLQMIGNLLQSGSGASAPLLEDTRNQLRMNFGN